MDSERRGPGAIEIIASLEVVILVIWPYLKNGWNPQQETKTFFYSNGKNRKNSQESAKDQDNDGDNGWVLFEKYNE